MVGGVGMVVAEVVGKVLGRVAGMVVAKVVGGGTCMASLLARASRWPAWDWLGSV